MIDWSLIKFPPVNLWSFSFTARRYVMNKSEYSEDWQSEQRATAISQNGNEGSHYFLIDQANGEKNLQSEKNDLTDEPITSDINCSNIMI